MTAAVAFEDHASTLRSVPTVPLGVVREVEAPVLRVGLVGFGRIGSSVAAMLLRDDSMRLEWVVRRSEPSEHKSAARVLSIDSDEPALLCGVSERTADSLFAMAPVDVVIDFSAESGLDYYGHVAAEHGASIVTAISKYSDVKQRQIRALSSRTSVLWSPNITLGINFMMLAAQTLQRIAPQADVEIVEEHFKGKPEVSGTALRLARRLGVASHDVHSLRAGGILGVHEVLFGFPTQTIRLRHETTAHDAFGHGAIFAARQIAGLAAGLYRMEDLLQPYFTEPGEFMEAVQTSHSRSGIRDRAAASLRAFAHRLDRR